MALLNLLRRAFQGQDLAIDPGTANTRIYAHGHGLIADCPTTTGPAGDAAHPEFLPSTFRHPCGSSGKAFSRQSPGVEAIQNLVSVLPLVRSSVQRVGRFGLSRCRILACCPVETTSEDRRTLIRQYQKAGGSDISLVPGPLAAAMGAGLDVESRYAQSVVSIGEGATEVAVIRAGAVIGATTSRKACAALRNELQALVRERFGIVLSGREAERLTHELGTAPGGNLEGSSSAIGTDLATGFEKRICLSSRILNQAIHPPILELGKFINGFLLDLPDDIACEVIESGIALTGGGACLRGIDDFLAALTRMEVRISQNPMHAAICGAAKMLTGDGPGEVLRSQDDRGKSTPKTALI